MFFYLIFSFMKFNLIFSKNKIKFLLILFFILFLTSFFIASIEHIIQVQKFNSIVYSNPINIIFSIVNIFLNHINNQNYWSSILIKQEIVNDQFQLMLFLLFDFFNKFLLYVILISVGLFFITFFFNLLILLFRKFITFNSEKEKVLEFIEEFSFSFIYSLIILVSLMIFLYVGIMITKYLYYLSPLSDSEFYFPKILYNFSSPNNLYYSSIPNSFNIANSEINILLYDRYLNIFNILIISTNICFIILIFYISYMLMMIPLYLIFNLNLKKLRHNLFISILNLILLIVLMILFMSAINIVQYHYYQTSLFKQLNLIFALATFILPNFIIIILMLKQNY